MSQIDQVCGLLAKKQELFLRYEEATYQIAAGDTEQIPARMQERTELRKEIDALSAQLTELYGDGRDSELLRKAAAARCQRDELPPELCPVFDAAMRIRAVITRIQETESQALERAQQERDDLLARIRSMNQGTGAVASKYYRSISPRAAGDRFRTVKKV